ncbi:MAG: HEAT repeat domain-containing protein [Peptococcia bacterium]
MALFKGKNIISNLQEWKVKAVSDPESVVREAGKKLQQEDFANCWDVLKELLPLLDRTSRRDLVRPLLAREVPTLKDLMNNREERELAIECLGYLPSREVIEILAELLGHKEDAVQLMASGALKNHTPRLVVPILLTGLLEEKIAAARAGEVLLAMGFYAQEMMLEAYPKATAQVQARLLELMVLGENPKCRPFVAEAIDSTEIVLKKKALEAIEAFMFREYWLEVAMCLAEDDWSIRAKSLEVLASLRVVEAVEYVEPFLQDQDPWVRECAAICIRNLQEIKERD